MTMKTLLLFDVDGTLTKPRNIISKLFYDHLLRLKREEHVGLAVVGGSDLPKHISQLGDGFVKDFDYVFSENGLVAFHNGVPLPRQSISAHLGEERLQTLMNEVMRYLADVRVPVKRGTFIEYRTGLINVSPCGRGVSQEERDAFEAFDNEHGIRRDLVQYLERRFTGWDLNFVIGGQISIDVYPEGWDKTYCLKYIPEEVTTIHFFGDKTTPGGNDYELYRHPRTVGHAVSSPDDTIKDLNKLFPGTTLKLGE